MMRADLPDLVLHWMSPLPPEQTDIAHYTARVLPSLAARARVVCWTSDPYWECKIERSGALVRYFDPNAFSPADLIEAGRLVGATEAAVHVPLIHLGNSAEFHGDFAVLARQIPSIVVLHDVVLLEMLFGVMDRGGIKRKDFARELVAQYGDVAQEALDTIKNSEKYVPDWAPQLPAFMLAAKAALGFIIHTPSAQRTVTGADTRPNWMLELPYMPSDAMPTPRAQTGPLRLMQFGYIGQNRRLLEVLEVLASVQDEVDFQFDVMGKLWDDAGVAERVAALGLEGRVTLHGFVDEPVLDAHLAQAHLVFNLRYPTMGEASGSQLRIWDAGAASVVRRAGWYASAPEDTLFHIEDDNDGEADALRALLLRVNADRMSIEAVSKAGRARLIEAHHPETYAEEIVKIARHMPDLLRERLLGQALERAGAAEIAPQAIANLRAPR